MNDKHRPLAYCKAGAHTLAPPPSNRCPTHGRELIRVHTQYFVECVDKSQDLWRVGAYDSAADIALPTRYLSDNQTWAEADAMRVSLINSRNAGVAGSPQIRR